MKKFCLTTAIAVFLLFRLNGIQAQTTQTKLNQVELMKHFIGTWTTEFAIDTVGILECKSLYNSGFDFYYKVETKGKILFEERTFTGYDEKADKLIKVFFSDSIPEFGILALWFTTPNTCEEFLFEDITNLDKAKYNTDKAKYKWIFEFKPPNLLVWSFMKNNKIVNSDTWTRVK
jgi:hypothetical protein